MNVLLWIVFGGLAGWLASMLVGDEAGLGMIGNVVVGIVGAFIGGFISDRIGVKPGQAGADRPTTLWGFIWAVIGAVILLLAINLIF